MLLVIEAACNQKSQGKISGIKNLMEEEKEMEIEFKRKELLVEILLTS